MHAAGDVSVLGPELATLELISSESPEDAIYRFDQFAARQGWRYCAELTDAGFRFTRFRIQVAIGNESVARDVAAQSRR